MGEGFVVGGAGEVSVGVLCRMVRERAGRAYISLFAPRYPPRPMEMAPAISSARPPKMTTLVFPSAERPAVRANGTVRPSERPMVASDNTRAVTWKPRRGEFCDSRSTAVSPEPWLLRRSRLSDGGSLITPSLEDAPPGMRHSKFLSATSDILAL